MNNLINDYQNSKVAIDDVIFTIHDNVLKVFLEKREKEPFINMFELPGGFIKDNESAEITLKRKVLDILGIDNSFCKQFFTFTQPLRDPRERVVSIGFLTLINSNDKKLSNKLLSRWYNINDLGNLAFDHKEIIFKAKQYLKENIDNSIVKNFMPEKFPLNDLQKVYEIIESKKYDNRNFRKKMIVSGIVKDCKEKELSVNHRPATLYHFTIK